MSRIPAGWTLTSFALRSVDQPEGVEREAFAHANAAGLVVNRRDDLYVVSHVRSGSFIQPGFVKVGDACAFALALAPLTDWNRPGRDLIADDTLRGAVVQLRERLNFGATVIQVDAPRAVDVAIDA